MLVREAENKLAPKLKYTLDAAGELERTVDVVRAECVVGNGYPYAVETADAVAVITMQFIDSYHPLGEQLPACH